MTVTDRLPEIQARAAKARAGSNDVDWLIGEVQTLRTQLALAEKHVKQLDDANTSLTERLAALQDGNEGAYRELYDAMNGPHFCPDRPIGQAAASEQVTA